MKKGILFLIALFAFCFLTPLYAWDDHTDSANIMDESDAVYLSKNLKILPKVTHEQNDAMHYAINAAYPYIVGDVLSESAKQFNRIVEKAATDQITQFKKYVAEDAPHMKTLPAHLQHNSLDIDYDIDIVNPHHHPLISVRFTIEGMQAGRAHPYHTHLIINYDFTTSKVLSLADLFKPKSNYLAVIASYSKKMLNEKLKNDNWMVEEGTQPTAAHYKNWNLEDDDLLITFLIPY
jgi:hypothetical protein